MSRRPDRAILSKRILLQRLVKFLAAAAVAAAVLGAAAALGSTLFQAPPRDAAEFAALVEAGSTHWSDVDLPGSSPARKKVVPRRWPGRPPADVRYLRSLDKLCSRQATEVGRLRRPSTPRQTAGYLSRWLRITARYQRKARALDPPKRLARSADRYLDAWEDAEKVVREIRTAVRHRESFSVLLLMDDLDALRLGADGMARRMNVTSCVAEGFPEAL